MNTTNEGKGVRNMRKHGLALVAGAAAAALAADAASAATIIVGPGGSIQDAVDLAVNGDTVKILDGRYNERVVIAGKSIKLQGQTKTGVILDGAGLSPNDVISVATDADGTVVRNLTIVFGNGAAATVHSGADGGSVENLLTRGTNGFSVYCDGNGITIKGVLARGDRHGIRNNGVSATFSGNKMYRISNGGGYALYGNGTTLVKSNTVEDVAHGITCYGDTLASERNSVRRARETGLYVQGNVATSTKDKARSVKLLAIGVHGGSPSGVFEPNVKNCANVGVRSSGNDCDVVLGKMDNCYLAIGGSASNSSISGNVIKNGYRGIRVQGGGTTVFENSLKNLQRGAIETHASSLSIHHNLIEAVGGDGAGAVDLYHSSGTVYLNTIGDVDGAAGIRTWNSSVTVGGYVSGESVGNVITDVSGAGIQMAGNYTWYLASAVMNTVTRCGDLDTGAIQIDGYAHSASGNIVTDAAGSGIVVTVRGHNGFVGANVVTGSGTNGILVDGYIGQMNVCVSYYQYGWPGYFGYDSNPEDEYPPPYYSGYYYNGACNGYELQNVNLAANNVAVSYNVVSYSGTEGIENHGNSATIRGNVVSFSGIYDFTNDGTINVAASFNNDSDTGDWSTVPGAQQAR